MKKNQQNLLTLQISRANYKNLKEKRALFIMRNALSKVWDKLLNSNDKKCRVYCNEKGCTKITIEFSAGCKVFKSKLGVTSYYAELYNVIITED